MYPDFLGIGAQKAGTTWLSNNLAPHPGIWMPPLKEIHYFDEKMGDPSNALLRIPAKLLGRSVTDRRWRRQVRQRTARHLRVARKRGPKALSGRDLLWELRYYAAKPDDRWYAALFEGGGGQVAGEITPAYSMLEPAAISHVHALMPDAKIIFMMRNPIERAWSQATMSFDKLKKRPIDTAEEHELQRNFGSRGSRLRTDYLRTLENWGSLYPEDRIFVGFLEDVNFFPGELLKSLYGFLGVDPSFEPPGVSKVVHARSTGRAPTGAMTYLARTYEDELARLEERFGGYASFWRYGAGRLVEDPPAEETIPYPLWGSEMWEEWLAARGNGSGPLRLRSGPRSTINASETWSAGPPGRGPRAADTSVFTVRVLRRRGLPLRPCGPSRGSVRGGDAGGGRGRLSLLRTRAWRL